MIIDLTQAQSVDLNEVGGKAYNLHKLVQIGVPVPPAFVVPASVKLQAEGFISVSLNKRLTGHEFIALGDKFAVRSSGIGEDGIGNSFAGIFESYLDVARDDITDAIRKVWRS